MWLTKVSAVLPESGYHVRWHGLMMEEARGITLHALASSRDSRLVMQLLQHNLNRTQAGCWVGAALAGARSSSQRSYCWCTVPHMCSWAWVGRIGAGGLLERETSLVRCFHT